METILKREAWNKGSIARLLRGYCCGIFSSRSL
jgi:hypothetical protein